MKIRNLIVLTLLLMLSADVMGQYKLTKETYKIGVMSLPKYYFRPENRTYGIEVKNTVPNLVDDSYISTGIDMIGWQEVHPSEATVTISISLPGLQKMSTIWKDSPTEDHKPNGEIVVHHHWVATLCYLFTAKATIKTTQESIDCRSVPANQEYQKIPVSGTYSTKAEADKYVNENLNKINKDVVKKNCDALIEDISKAMRKFVPAPKTEEVNVTYLLEPKNPFIVMMKDAYSHLPQELYKIKADASIESVKPAILGWIAKFKDVYNKLADDKTDEKNAKEEMLKNITMLYYVIEDFDQCSTNAQVLKDTYKDKEGDKYLRLSKQAQNELTKHKIETRHFSLY